MVQIKKLIHDKIEYSYFPDMVEIIESSKGIQFKCKKCGRKIKTTDSEYQIVLCPCEFEKRDKEYHEKEIEKQEERFYKKIENSGLPYRFFDADFENVILDDMPKSFLSAMEILKKYVEEIEVNKNSGLGLYVYGDVGRGKTYMTACVLKELLKRNEQCLFTSFFDIYEELKECYRRKLSTKPIVEKYIGYKFLFIDDFGKERFTEWANEIVFQIINKRYNQMRPTILSSNNSLVQCIDNGLEKAVADRITQTCEKVKIVGKNFRHL